MNSTTLPGSNKVIKSWLNQPAISIILPFEPKMNAKSATAEQLKRALEKVQQEVTTNQSEDISILVMQKLKHLVSTLNYSTYKKSIAIYVSPVFEKVLYFDIPVESKVIISECFDIRDLIKAKKQTRQYLILVLSDSYSSIYRGVDIKLTKIKSNIPYCNDLNTKLPLKQQVLFPGSCDPVEEKLRRMVEISDQGLNTILNAYQLPVFVVGPAKALSYFKASTSNENRILEYAHASSDLLSPTELANVIGPHIKDWKKVKMKYFRQQLDIALAENKLAGGIGNVWKMASEGKGRLLLLEHDYRYDAQLLESEDGLYTSKGRYHKYSHIRDTVDDIIERVLENGGDVEFVEKGLLDAVKNIALQ